jgi:Na+-driven multidrug efflux pump
LEWFYWEVILCIAGTFGSASLSIHAIAMGIVYLNYCLASGVMVSLCTRVGNVIPISASRAKAISLWGTIVSSIFFFFVCLSIYVLRGPIIGLFSDKDDVVIGCNKIWLDMVIFTFNTSIFYVLSGSLTALGMQWHQGLMTGLGLFGLGIPLIYYNAISPEDGSIEDVWRWQWPPYSVVSVIFALLLIRADWEQIATFVRIREGIVDPASSE